VINDGTRQVNGRFGAARAFEGRNLSRIVTDIPWRSLGSNYTLAAWIRIEPGVTNQMLIGGHTGRFKGLMLRNGMLTWEVSGRTALAYPFTRYGEFVHVALVSDGPQGFHGLYENGVVKDRRPLPRLQHPSETIAFGQVRNPNPAAFTLDETVLWNRPLTLGELQTLAYASRSLGQRLAGAIVWRQQAYRALETTGRQLLQILNLFDPRYHSSRIFRSGLPEIQLRLSKNDRKHFNQRHNFWLANGCRCRGYDNARDIQVFAGRRGFAARMRLYLPPDPAADIDGRRMAFILEMPEGIRCEGQSHFLFLPVEDCGLTLPLIVKDLAAQCGWPATRLNLFAVRINGSYQGLYYAFDPSSPESLRRGWRPQDLLEFARGLPLARGDLPAADARCAAELAPLLLNDATSPLTRREIRFALRSLRKTLTAADAEFSGRDQPEVFIARACAALDSRLFLGANPCPDLVSRNLDLRPRNINGLALRWSCDRPDLVRDDGALRQPTNSAPVNVVLTAHLKGPATNGRRDFPLTILPAAGRFPVIRLATEPGPIEQDGIKRTCLAHYDSADTAQTGGWLEGELEIHGNCSAMYPKKPYHLELREPHPFPGLRKTADFALLAEYLDIAMVKNKFAYDVFRSLATERAPRPVPRTQHVELVLNGVYEGVYEFGEILKAELLGFKPYDPQAPRHAVLYKFSGGAANFRYPAHSWIVQKEPAWQQGGGDYWEPYDEFIRLVGRAPPEEFQQRIGELVDLDEIIDAQLLLNLVFNRDGADHNLFLARDSGAAARFVIVPWDYDESLGGITDLMLSNYLFDRLMGEYPGYNRKLKERWRALRHESLSDAALAHRLDDFDRLLTPVLRRNYRRWEPWRGRSYESVRALIRDWLPRRLRFLDDYLAHLPAEGYQPPVVTHPLPDRTSGATTSLHLAALEGSAESVRHWLEQGIDVNARERDGATPLHAAAFNGTPAAVKELLAHGADVNARTQFGWTPLHYAVKYDETEEVAGLLIESGADLFATNNVGETPLYLIQTLRTDDIMPTIQRLRIRR
jgi:hypothetical protein